MRNTKTERKQQANRLETLFPLLRKKGKKALAVFLMGGDPSLAASLEMLKAAVHGGADILEIGVPFSDPLADGPVIQKSATRALKNNTRLDDILSLAYQLRLDIDTPIVLLSYWNPIYQYDPLSFFKQAKKAGVDGIIIPDLPFEEKRPFYQDAKKHGLVLIDFLTPATRKERAGSLLKNSRGFIYCVTVSGITGIRDTLSDTLSKTTEIARRHTRIPLLAGFGISSPAQACEASRWVDGVIVGSALVQEVDHYKDITGILPKIIQEKVYAFRKVMDSAFPLDEAQG